MGTNGRSSTKQQSEGEGEARRTKGGGGGLGRAPLLSPFYPTTAGPFFPPFSATGWCIPPLRFSPFIPLFPAEERGGGGRGKGIGAVCVAIIIIILMREMRERAEREEKGEIPASERDERLLSRQRKTIQTLSSTPAMSGGGERKMILAI